MKLSGFANVFWTLAVVLAGVFYPRLMILGDFPHMDEGLSVFLGELCAEAFSGGGQLPLMHGLPLEALLLCWTSFLPGFTVIWLRLCDLLFACVAGWLLCRIYQEECGNAATGLALALLVLCPMNYPGVIDAGYKNAIPPAFCFLFGAFLLTRNNPDPKSIRWFFCGLCLCAAVLFREPFVVFALLGCVVVMVCGGGPAALRYIAGGIAGLVPILLLLFWLQGIDALNEIYEAYIDRGLLYAQETGRIWHNFQSGIYKALHNFTGPIAALLGVGALFVYRRLKFGVRIVSAKRGLFWLAVFLLPLLEPMTKIGFLYHFSVCLPGLGGLAAWLVQEMSSCQRKKTGAGIVVLVSLCVCISLAGLPSPANAPMTLQMIGRFPEQGWPDEWAEKSNPLMAAREIRKALPPGGTLSASAFSFFIYPAAGAMPPKTERHGAGYGLSDLSRYYVKLGMNSEKLASELKANPPDVIAIGKAFDVHERDYAASLSDAVKKSGLYRLVSVVNPDAARHYGWLAYQIYRKKTG